MIVAESPWSVTPVADAAEVQVGVVHGGGQRLLQVDAVDAPVRRAEPGAVVRPAGVRGDPLGAAPVAVDQLGRLGGDGVEGLSDAEAVELPGAVRRERDGRADLAQLVGALVEVDGDPGALQGDPEGEPADARPDDGDAGAHGETACRIASASSAGRVKLASWLPGVSTTTASCSRGGKRSQPHSPGGSAMSSVERM